MCPLPPRSNRPTVTAFEALGLMSTNDIMDQSGYLGFDGMKSGNSEYSYGFEHEDHEHLMPIVAAGSIFMAGFY